MLDWLLKDAFKSPLTIEVPIIPVNFYVYDEYGEGDEFVLDDILERLGNKKVDGAPYA